MPSIHVVEVVPRVNLTTIPHAPDYVAGSLNFRGLPIPVVDLCLMTDGRPCSKRLHTRIIICSLDLDGREVTLGIAAEKVTGTSRLAIDQFIDSGMRLPELLYLGGVMTTGTSTRQLLLLESLVEMLQPILFVDVAGSEQEEGADG